jgi:hypothetical protein
MNRTRAHGVDVNSVAARNALLQAGQGAWFGFEAMDGGRGKQLQKLACVGAIVGPDFQNGGRWAGQQGCQVVEINTPGFTP